MAEKRGLIDWVKRGNVMHLELKKDIRTLLADTEVFQEDLEMTKRDFSNCVKEYKINEWERIKIIEHLKKLKSDLIIIQVDCITLMGQTYQNHGTWQIFNRFYLTFFSLDSLLNELKKIRKLLGLYIDFSRSNETIIYGLGWIQETDQPNL